MRRKKFVFLSGLPRTGSTLLANLLAHNKHFYLEGNSGLCQLMWDTQHSCDNLCREQLDANDKHNLVKRSVLTELPYLYYKDVKQRVIFDKGRTWTLDANLQMAERYIDLNIKTIIMYRPIDEIVKSYIRLHPIQDQQEALREILQKGGGLMDRPLQGIMQSTVRGGNNLYVSYNSLVNDTENTLRSIYDFIGEKYSDRDVTSVDITVQQNDAACSIPELHKVRHKVGKVDNDTILPPDVQEYCDHLSHLMLEAIREIQCHLHLCGD